MGNNLSDTRTCSKSYNTLPETAFSGTNRYCKKCFNAYQNAIKKPSERTCTTCKTVKPLTAYNGRSRSCNECKDAKTLSNASNSYQLLVSKVKAVSDCKTVAEAFEQGYENGFYLPTHLRSVRTVEVLETYLQWAERMGMSDNSLTVLELMTMVKANSKGTKAVLVSDNKDLHRHPRGDEKVFLADLESGRVKRVSVNEVLESLEA